MISVDMASQLVGSTVQKLVLIVWPPYGEDNLKDIDVSVAFRICEERGHEYINFCIDKNDNWHAEQKSLIINSMFDGNLYEARINGWFRQDFDDVINYEYFDVTNSATFSEIVKRKIVQIDLFYMEGDDCPFGVKLIFENDFLMILPGTDGTALQTSKFNCYDGPSRFSSLGNVKVISTHG